MKLTTENSANRRDLKLPTVQVLRGVAASMVVFDHFASIYQTGAPRPSWIYQSGLGNLGAAGVDIFFVISGFIMVYTTKANGGAKSALTFLKKRALRIYPLYWVWTTLLLVLWLTGLARLSGDGPIRFHYSFAYIVESYLLVPASNGEYFHPLLAQGWTLSFEMLFYILFACSIYVRLMRGKLPFLVIAFSVLALLPTFIDVGAGLTYLLSSPMVVEFLYGVLAAYLLCGLPTRLSQRTANVVGICLILIGASALLATTAIHTTDSRRWFIWGIPALVIVSGALLRGAAPAPRIFVYLGDTSYSIYLAHGFFTLAYASAFKHVRALQDIQPDLSIILLGIATIALTSLTYTLIERPLTRVISFGREYSAPPLSPMSDTSMLSDTVQSSAG